MKSLKAYLVLAAAAGALGAMSTATANAGPNTVLVSEAPWLTDTFLTNFSQTGLGPTTFYSSYAAATPSAIFNAGVNLVVLEGGASTDANLQAYLTANYSTIQNWVSTQKGQLLIQSAGWDNDITFGPYGLTLVPQYNYASGSGQLTAAGQTAFGGVAPGISTNWTGGFLAHDVVTGPLIDLADGNTVANGTLPIIGYTADGNGWLMLSGLTDSQFQSGSGPWGSYSLVNAELLYLNELSSPGPVPGAGLAGFAALALAGFYARARRA